MSRQSKDNNQAAKKQLAILRLIGVICDIVNLVWEQRPGLSTLRSATC
jgi:hypothetical protein